MSISPVQYNYNFENFVLHPTKCSSNSLVRKVTLVASLIFNILTLGIVFRICSLMERVQVQEPIQVAPENAIQQPVENVADAAEVNDPVQPDAVETNTEAEVTEPDHVDAVDPTIQVDVVDPVESERADATATVKGRRVFKAEVAPSRGSNRSSMHKRGSRATAALLYKRGQKALSTPLNKK